MMLIFLILLVAVFIELKWG